MKSEKLERLEDRNLARAAALVASIEKQMGGLQKKIAANIEENKRLHSEIKELNQDLAEAKEYLDDLTKAQFD